MMDIRLATRDELASFLGKPVDGFDVVAVIGRVGDYVVGVGGFSYDASGEVVAWCQIRPEARLFKFAIHRTAKMMLAHARTAGETRIVAERNSLIPGAGRWLESLGFRPDPESPRMYVWEPN
jgi:hypothetical protein